MISKTLQNRVDPWGVLHAVPNRGALMGNRGILHDDDNRIVKPWAHRAWVTCLLDFDGIKRPKPFSKGNYSELFFMDEVTAFSAGHRPCAHCQRQRHLAFKAAWCKANVAEEFRAATVMPDVDKILHAERAVAGGGKVTFDAALDELPRGTMFEHQGMACLVAARGVLPWSFDGYGAPNIMHPATIVKVLTPQSIVRAFAAGFAPLVHPSAGQ